MIFIFDVYGVVYEGDTLNRPLLDIMKSLKNQGIKVALASNMPSAQRILFWEALNLKEYAYEFFCSGDLNVAKPAALFYSRVSAALGTEPESILFFDDSAANVEAAKACGWHAFLYTDPQSTLKIIENYNGR